MLSFKQYPKRYGLGLLFIIIVQGASKLWPVKFGGKKIKLRVKKLKPLDKAASNPKCLIFFRPPTLTGHSFTAPWAMMIYSTSFKSPKSYLFGYYWKNSKAALLRYAILAQSNPKSYHEMEIDQELLEVTVYIYTLVDNIYCTTDFQSNFEVDKKN